MTGPFGWVPLYDDAYITLTSAMALGRGGIPAYPDTSPLAGITSPVHLLMVWLGLRVAEPLTALWLASILAVAAYGAGLWALTRAWGLRTFPSVAFMLAGLGAGWTPYHLVNGLETGWVLAAVTWALWAAWQGAWWLPLLLGTLPFVRPELALLAGALAAWHLRRAAVRHTLVLMAAGALPWVIWLTWEVGSPVPQTAMVKRQFLGDGCLTPAQAFAWLEIGLVNWVSGLGLVATVAVALPATAFGRLLGGTFLLALAAYTTGLPSHLPLYHAHRYLYGWWPVLLVGGLAPLAWSRWMAVPVTAAVLLAAPGASTARQAWASAFLPEQAATAAWVRAHVPPDEPVAVIDAGHLAFSTPHRLVDVVGLKSPSSAAVHAASPVCAGGRGASLSRILTDSGVRYFVSWGEWEQWLRLSEDLRQQGWSVELARPRPAGVSGGVWYPVFRLSPPEGRARPLTAS